MEKENNHFTGVETQSDAPRKKMVSITELLGSIT